MFDPIIRIHVPLDTLCVTLPCGDSVRVRLDSPYFGAYRFTLQGRDTDAVCQVCRFPSDLGSNPLYFDIDVSRLGLETNVGVRNTTWLPLDAVHASGKRDGGQRARR